MKILLDTANLDDIPIHYKDKDFLLSGLRRRFTPRNDGDFSAFRHPEENTSVRRRDSSIKSQYKSTEHDSLIAEICELIVGSVSVEVISEKYERDHFVL